MNKGNLKKILMVSYTSFLQKFYQSLPQEMARISGAEVKVLMPPYWKELWSGGKISREELPDPGFEVTVGDILFTGNLHFAVFRTRLVSLLRDFQPDIIDLEDEPFNAGSFQMALYRRWFSPRSRLVLHASQNLFKRYPPPFNWMERYVLKRAEAVLARNAPAQEVLRRKGYEGCTEIVTHGVDTWAFAPREAPQLRRELSPHGRPIVGYVGAFTEQKGLSHLLRAAVGLPVKVVLLGAGAEKPALERLARQLEVEAHFAPPTAHEQVARYMNAMDIFVLPSLTRPGLVEKFGRVLIEAMASGTPVIGSSCGEIPRVIGEAGLIFREGDEEDLRRQITTLLENPTRRRELIRRGRTRVETHFSWPAVAQKTLAIYEEITK